MILKIESEDPIEKYKYKVVATGGQDHFGNVNLIEEELPILLGHFSTRKADELDAIIVASDLQGNVERDGAYKLLVKARIMKRNMVIQAFEKCWKDRQIS